MKKSKQFGIFIGLVLAAGLPATASLVGHWTFDGNLNESTGFAGVGVHNGQIVDANTNIVAATYSSDTPAVLGGGQSLDLRGADIAMRVLGSNQQNAGSAGEGGGLNPSYLGTFDTDLIAAGAFTISVWVKGIPNGNWEPYISKNGENAGYQIRRRSNSSNPSFTLRGTAGADDPQGASTLDNSWHLLTSVFDGVAGTRKMYFDGVLDANINLTGEGGTWSSPRWEWLMLGGRDSGGGYTGFSQVMLDDVRIYDEALSEAAVQQLAGQIPEPATASLILLGLGGLLGLRRRR